jgi:hypothetical protein
MVTCCFKQRTDLAKKYTRKNIIPFKFDVDTRMFVSGRVGGVFGRLLPDNKPIKFFEKKRRFD